MSRFRGPVIAACVAAAVCLTLSVAPAWGAAGGYNGLANTPPMGFNDWNAYGCNVSADLIEGAARYHPRLRACRRPAIDT